ncbi:reverse transcriptase [Plakobranchus ocellatus]|uniref:Reverse transcriptase n=1 Tax=Plakobranchus ocellatus TaxID=259542 RepID=A0AAV4CH49_9GAST|nr:reverse transcriptase [Plakobranchus ocellatus]
MARRRNFRIIFAPVDMRTRSCLQRISPTDLLAHRMGRSGAISLKSNKICKPFLPRSRRHLEVDTLRKQKRKLKKQIKAASSEETNGLLVIWRQLKARHSALSRVESARKKRSQKRKNQKRFIRDPFQFARQLFQQPKSGTLIVDREELETHLKKSYSDPTREIPLEETTGLVWPAAPGIKFDSKPPSLQEVIAVVNKARA